MGISNMTLSTSNNVVCPVVLTSAVSVARMILFHVPPRMYAGMGELGTESVATPLTKTTNLSLMESAFKHEALGQAGRSPVFLRGHTHNSGGEKC